MTCMGFLDAICFRGRERRHTRPEALVSDAKAVDRHAPSVGRFQQMPSLLGLASTCVDTVSPGLGAVSATGPHESRQTSVWRKFQGIPVGARPSERCHPSIRLFCSPLLSRFRGAPLSQLRHITLVPEDPTWPCGYAATILRQGFMPCQ